MTLLEIVTALILLLITTLIILNKIKKHSTEKNPISQAKAPESVKQESTPKSVEKPTADAEPNVKPQAHETAIVSAPELKSTDKPVSHVEPAAKPSAYEPAVVTAENNSLPQDSILRRHYLAHLCSMIESFAPRPTDSVLCRHYDTMLVAKLEQCLSDKQAMAQLLEDYANHNSTAKADIEFSVKPQAPETKAASPEINNSSLPQDSILRRHYLAHLYSMIESLASPRPTDSVLCRHHDTMLIARLDQCLNNHKAMTQLRDDYEKKYLPTPS
jgi:hypothetical protein